MTLVRCVYDYLNKLSPFSRQDKDDNSGLIVGDADGKVGKILICLDVTRKVAEEAAETGTDLIIAHHPVIFIPVKKITPRDVLFPLIKNNVSVIGYHTNHDIAGGGVTDIMLERLGFAKSDTVILPMNPDGSGYGKIAEFERGLTAKELAELCKKAFNCAVVKYVDGKKPIRRVGLCSGAGNFAAEAAFDMDCDAFICGDVKWDRFVYAENYGFTLIDAGHFHTENIFCEPLRDKLRAEFPNVAVEKAVNCVDLCEYV